MNPTPEDEVVVGDGRSRRHARLYHWFLDHLAKFPGRVTALTFVAGAVVTVVVVLIDGDGSATTVVSLVATLWALFFAVMIYLLTARDTDTVLEQIADLREQLSTALAAPDEGEAESQEPAPVESAPVEPAPHEPAPTEQAPHEPVAEGSGRTHPVRSRPGAGEQGGDRAPRLLTGSADIIEGVPRDLIDAWVSATGKTVDQLSRAWTRDPRTDRQWVLEAGQERWVVFSRGGRSVGVIPLDASARVRGRGRRPGGS